MNALLLIAAGALALGMAQSTSETESETRPFPGAEAQVAMARLAPLAGDWTATVYRMTETGWSEAGTEHAHIYFMLNDLALREDPDPDGVNGWQLESTIQYDQNRDLYRLVAMDDTWGNMDIYEGGFDSEGRLVVTNLRSGTSYVGDDGATLHFRLTTAIESPDRNVFSVDMSADQGASWQAYQRIVRIRQSG
ncbi:DUF1579 family protein [Maricaulis sp.]|uniref:DUF1579 family protein n=1 Tax=Maricaulis sp. TaxID=1486257 RepID=UPI00261AA0CF|nr:DUF1579 family protein [Maricaulis sp.]